MERVIQSSMFYNFYLFLSILLCNVDSALVSDSNAYIWISNYNQMFEFIFECGRNVFSACSWKMASSDPVGKKIHQELVNAYKKNFVFYWEWGG